MFWHFWFYFWYYLGKVNRNVTVAAKPVSQSSIFIVSTYCKSFHFQVPGGVEGVGGVWGVWWCSMADRQTDALGHVAGRQQLVRTTRPLRVQPLHSKCNTVSGKTPSSCTLPLPVLARSGKLWNGEVQWGEGQVRIFTWDIQESTALGFFVSRHLSSACHSRHSPAAGSVRLQMRHNCCLSDQAQLTNATRTGVRAPPALPASPQQPGLARWDAPQRTVNLASCFKSNFKTYYKPYYKHTVNRIKRVERAINEPCYC